LVTTDRTGKYGLGKFRAFPLEYTRPEMRSNADRKRVDRNKRIRIEKGKRND